MKYIKLDLKENLVLDVKEDSFFLVDVEKSQSIKAPEKNITLNLNDKGITARFVYTNILNNLTENISIQVNHNAENTHSLIILRSVLEDNADLKFYGNIKVSSQANNCSGYLDVKALSSGENISWETKPNLEIQNDLSDIRHKAGLIDYNQDQVFYLENRGMSEEEAKNSLKKAFLMEAIITIPDEEIKNELLKELQI